MDIYYCDGHNEHSDDWSFKLPHHDMSVCLACLVEILEDNNLLTVKKKPALLQFIKIIQQCPDVNHLLKNHLQIVNHILFIFIDLLRLEDAALVSQTLDACLLLLTRLESEELIISVMDHIQTQCDKECDNKLLFPFYLFTGRLVQGIPFVVPLLIPQYESLIRHFCDGLNCPDEDVQSALVYIFVYLYEGCVWETSINRSIQLNLVHQVVSTLNSAKSPALILNTLGLLKKFINSDQTTCMLMKMSFDGVTMVTVLKKFLVSKNDVFKKVSTQILAAVLSKECSTQYANTILQSDIVGIESILKSLQVLEEMKNLDLVEKGLNILSTILQRQPDNVPLFINSKMVSECLSVIHGGIKQHQQQVFQTSLTAFLRILRKDHLLLPVPFHELMNILSIISKKIWNYSELKLANMKKSKLKSSVYQPVDTYCNICNAASRLLGSCMADPRTCQSNYEVPDTCNQQQHNTAESFLQFIIHNCEDTCIPIILNHVQQTRSHMVYQSFFRHLCQLYELDHDQMVLVLERLVSSGFITIVLEIKAEMRGTEVKSDCCDKFLMILCHVLQRRDQATTDWPVESDLSDVKYSLSDLPTVLSQTSIKMEACDIYIFLLYHTFHNDEMIYSGQDLQYVLLTLLDKRGRWEDLSPLIKKSYIFLWAMSACLLDSEQQKSVAPEYMVKTLSCEPIEEWYTHHQALLSWIYTEVSITDSVCVQVIDKWMQHLVKDMTENGNVDVLEDTDIDTEPLIELFEVKKFTKCLVDLLTISSPTVTRIILYVIKVFCSKSEEEKRRNFLNYLREIIIGTIQEIYLHSHNKPEDVNMSSVFDLLLCTYEDLPPSASSSHDIKLIYHIIKWLPSNNLPPIEEKWLQIILHYMTSSEKTLQNRVMSLIVQIKEFVVKLDNLIEDAGNRHLSALAVDLVSTIITLTSDLDQYNDRCISINLQCFEPKLRSQDTFEVTSYLRLLSALLEVKFKCPLIQLKYQGRFQYDTNCPLTLQDFKTLYIFLQQMSLQEVNIVKIYAVRCLNNMIEYLSGTAPLLAEDLLQNPWNSLMMEVLIQTTDLRSPDIVDSTLTILYMFLIHEKSCTFIFQREDLMEEMAGFLTKLLQDRNSLFDTALLRNILQKVSEVLPKKHSSLKKLFDNVQVSSVQIQTNDVE